jgi:biofilm PGA synthesis N-glycosyltransferase PgaC
MKPAFLNSRVRYLLFIVPIILAYASWTYFPEFAQYLVTSAFGYHPSLQQASWLWLYTTQFFYTWYTFLAIGVGGILAVAATFARLQSHRTRQPHYPMVSFVVPAYNGERHLSRCITSLFKSAEEYNGPCEIIVVDDGSIDYTYETAWSTIQFNRAKCPNVRGRVIRHSANMGKVESIRTGVDRALGGLIAVVDADSWWLPDTLAKLADHMLSNGKKAVTGYIHPSDGVSELDSYVIMQQLEYSQGQGITRHAQSLGNNVVVIPGALSLYDAEALRSVLSQKRILSVTEDLEIALEMHKRGAKIGYVNTATGTTVAPVSFNALWNQRLRWFTGWLHNTLNIHRDMMLKRSRLTLFLWYCYIFEYGGAFIDLLGLMAFPLLFWLAPDRIYFAVNLLMFMPYGLLIGIANQAIALKYAYNQHNYRSLLFYTPFYPILRLINVLARLTSSVKYVFGYRGSWNSAGK